MNVCSGPATHTHTHTHTHSGSWGPLHYARETPRRRGLLRLGSVGGGEGGGEWERGTWGVCLATVCQGGGSQPDGGWLAARRLPHMT